MPGDFALQSGSAGLEFAQGQLLCGGRGPRHEIRDAAPECRQLDVFLRGQQTRGEPGREQRRPEPIPRPGEMVANGAGVQTRVDATEEHAEAGLNHVTENAAPGGIEVRLGWSRHDRRCQSNHRCQPSGIVSATSISMMPLCLPVRPPATGASAGGMPGARASGSSAKARIIVQKRHRPYTMKESLPAVVRSSGCPLA